MKSGQVGSILGVDRGSILNWTERFGEFLSPEARREAGNVQREYIESDVLVLNTIRVLRKTTSNWDEIRAQLQSGFRDNTLPDGVSSVQVGETSIELYSRMVQTVQERDAALKERDELKHEVEALNKLLRDEQQKSREIEIKYLREIADLNREIGKLEGRTGSNV